MSKNLAITRDRYLEDLFVVAPGTYCVYAANVSLDPCAEPGSANMDVGTKPHREMRLGG